MQDDTFDYIIVGAGSAGAAAAARLSQSGQRSVLLLDAGPPDRHILSRIPLGVAGLLGSGLYLRHYFTEPESQLKDRRIYWPRGWVTGGSSTVNGMIWVHGTPHIYDEWAQDGCPGWSFDDLRPWFRKIESFQGGDPAFRGDAGPMTITEFQPVDPLPAAFLDAVEQAGIGPRVRDFNAGGFGGSFQQLNTRRGLRCNTRMAYLDPARGRQTLSVLTQAMVTRIKLTSGRATGVQAVVNGREVDLHARREVILCGGTFNSAQLLELSGIGQREVLQSCGIPLQHELRWVGENLSEHVYSPVVFRCKPGVSWNRKLSSLTGKMSMAARWLMHRDGPLSTATITAQAFVPQEAGSNKAEVKLQVQQASAANNRGKGKMTTDDFDAFTLASFQIKPHSRGSCHIHSADPMADPRMTARHFTDERDVQACLDGLRMARRAAAAPALAAWVEDEVRPGPAAASDEALVDYLRATGATAYHPVGTCRMGQDADSSVVDPQFRVHGIRGLRVADGSVMPSIASTNTNAICIVFGERVADFIAQEEGVPL